MMRDKKSCLSIMLYLLWLGTIHSLHPRVSKLKMAYSSLPMRGFSSAAILSLGLASTSFSPFGNLKLALEAIQKNPEAISCTIDTQNVKDNQSSCQQMDQIVRFRAGKLLTINQDWGGSVSTGASVWNGENVAVKYLEDNLGSEKLRDKKVIELGSGVGLSSIIASILGASEVVITDGNEDVLKLADQNVRNNLDDNIQRKVRTARLRWNTEDEMAFKDKTWDYILASDVTYKKSAWTDLMHTISELSSAHSKTILSMEPRNVGEVEGVLQEAARFGLQVSEQALDRSGSVCNLLCPRLFILSKTL